MHLKFKSYYVTLLLKAFQWLRFTQSKAKALAMAHKSQVIFS